MKVRRRPYTVVGLVADDRGEVVWVPTRVYRGHVAHQRVDFDEWGAQTYARTRARAIDRALVLWREYLAGERAVEVSYDPPSRRWPFGRRQAVSTPPLQTF
jgi:hypothetical protein